MEDKQLEQIIYQAKNGDLQQFNQIIEYYQKPLYHYIYCIVNCTQDAEDIVQDTFLMALRKINQYKSETKFSAWMYRIARNISYNFIKKRKKILLVDCSDMTTMLEDRNATLMFENNLQNRMNEIFQRMTFQEKNIMVLRIYEEKAYEEIAYIMKISQSACRKKYERARKKFIALYQDDDKEEYRYGRREKLKNVFSATNRHDSW